MPCAPERVHALMVNPYPPASGGTTVHSGEADDAGRGVWWGVAIIIVAVAVAVVFGVATHGDDDVARAVVGAQAGSLSASAPTGAPDGAPGDSADGVPFPVLTGQQGWRPVARRVDHVSDRRVTTVIYASDGRRLTYSIVAGPPLGAPPMSRSVGGRLPVVLAFDADGRAAVITVRSGHSVIVSAVGVSRAALVQAARAG